MKAYWNDHQVTRIHLYVERYGVRSAWVKLSGIPNMVHVTLRDIRVGA